LALSTLGLVSAGPTYTTCPGGFKNGEKFTEGSFVKKCSADGMSYSVSIIGCLTPEKNEIQIGKELKEGNWVHKCIGTANGGAKIEMERATASETGPRENMKCMDKYSNGEKFTEGNFVKLCTSSPTHASVTIAACLTPAKKEISLGGKLEENKLIYSCINTGNGARMSTELAVKGCQDGKYKKGIGFYHRYSKWKLQVEGDLVKLCTSSPTHANVSIIACLTPQRKPNEIKIGAKLTENKVIYSCIKTAKGAKMETEPIVKGCENGKYQKGMTTALLKS
ncbi:hypothetical protein PFISCL1PPCAC_1858, partial [Pristionchus fissidentatus]